MLAKPYRFPISRQFNILKKEGRLVNGSLFGLLVKNRPDNSLPRFGFVVSLKIDKRSVARHRLKRLLSEAVRLNLEKIKGGSDIIFLAKRTLSGKTFTEVETEVMALLAKAQILKEER